MSRKYFALFTVVLVMSTNASANDDDEVNRLHSELSQAIDGAQRQSTAQSAYAKCVDLQKLVAARSSKDDFWGTYWLAKVGRCKAFAMSNGVPADSEGDACGQALGVAKKIADLAAKSAANPDSVPAQISDVELFLKDEFTYAVNMSRNLKCTSDIEALRPANAK